MVFTAVLLVAQVWLWIDSLKGRRLRGELYRLTKDNSLVSSDRDQPPFRVLDPLVDDPTRTFHGGTFNGPVVSPDPQLTDEQLRRIRDEAHFLAAMYGVPGLFEQEAPDSDETWWVIDEPLSTEEEQRVAEQTADSINHTLARLFVRLGPPPTALGGSVVPVSSDDGGSAQ
ncbi:hypothetical protein ACFWAZ_39005 [Streptomyces collinus]|uniref:hypothetical protein n=1 Tax=Streptomyces collinus TaxID=42684 RepID=UPI0036620FD1